MRRLLQWLQEDEDGDWGLYRVMYDGDGHTCEQVELGTMEECFAASDPRIAIVVVNSP